ncbi:hypothetical protein MmiHf6_02430 [Methanimicrococcus hongohii]|uniref:HFX-2341-like N-terminal domain-containing protein n=1 Tax=Methanimicrococcus hongohii TaxID=3028295 RepID=A0AA96UYJ2_9EURY|nr:DUF6293 family protein [Methanimicrococcus sp. Hf6]WNY22949.1 hypothetical protein MmiHf6_02430 [Methanimicrococcus sp. Hf6]
MHLEQKKSKAIHICPVGFYPEPILAVFRSNLPCDKFYLLYNEHNEVLSALAIVEDSMNRIGQKNIEKVCVDPYNYADVVAKILSIHHKEKKNDVNTEFYINFTSGTNVVAGACCSASYFIGATLYYIMDARQYPELSSKELIKIIPVPKIPDMEKMKPFSKNLLLSICEKENGIMMEELSRITEGSTPQRLNHYLTKFIESGLVLKKKEGRNTIVIPTEQGKMFSTWVED